MKVEEKDQKSNPGHSSQGEDIYCKDLVEKLELLALRKGIGNFWQQCVEKAAENDPDTAMRPELFLHWLQLNASVQLCEELRHAEKTVDHFCDPADREKYDVQTVYAADSKTREGTITADARQDLKPVPWRRQGFACKNKDNIFFDARNVSSFETTMGSQGEVRSRESGDFVDDYLFLDISCGDFTAKYDARLDEFAEAMIDAYKTEWSSAALKDTTTASEPLQVVPVGTICETEVVAIGRIIGDAEGPLRNQSILLEGSSTSSNGRRSQLWLEKLRSVCLFPGQVVAALGVCTHGEVSKFIPRKIFSGLPVPHPLLSVSKLQAAATRYKNNNVHLIIASGPFKKKHCDKYEALDFLRTRCIIDKPHIVIFIGPFVDWSEFQDRERDCKASLVDAYERIFSVISNIATVLRNKGGRIIVLPSVEDPLHPFPIPQPPLNISLAYLNGLNEDSTSYVKQETDRPFEGTKKKYRNIEFISNPGYLRMNDLTICLTSTDIIKPVEDKLLCTGSGSDRKVEKICTELFRQRTIFPSFLPEYGANPKLASWLHFPLDRLPELVIFCSRASTKQPAVYCTFSRLFINCAESLCRTTVRENAGFLNVYFAPPTLSSEASGTCSGPSEEPVNVDHRVFVELVKPLLPPERLE